MKSRLVLIIAALVIVALGFGIIYWISQPEPSEPLTPTDPFNTGGLQGGTSTDPVTTAQTITLVGRDGASYTIPNIVAGHAAYEQPSGTYYYVTAAEDGTPQNDRYSIVLGTDSSISIGLLTEPVGEVRREAEQALVNLTRLSRSELCALNVSVMAPIDVSDTYAATDLGLSFCPGAVELP